MKRITERGLIFFWTSTLLAVISGCIPSGVHNDARTLTDFNPFFFPDIKLPQKKSEAPFLGIYMGTVPDKYLSETVKKESAVYVDNVIADSGAERAGMIAGDIIVAFDGKIFDDKEVEPLKQLRKTIINKKIGDHLMLSILREGVPMTIDAELGEKKKIPARVKPHPEIDGLQTSMNRTDSVIYHTVQSNDRLEDFLNTIAQLGENSLLLDSYKIAPDNPFRLSEINYLLQNPTNIIPVSRGITSSFLSHLETGTYDLSSLVHEAALRLDAGFNMEPGGAPSINNIDEAIKYIIETVILAESYRKDAFKGLSDEEVEFLEKETLKMLSEDDIAPEMEERLIKIATKVDYPMLFKSMAEVSKTVSSEVIRVLRRMKFKEHRRPLDIPVDVVEGDVSDIIETQFGKIIIGGPGMTHYKDKVFAIIDSGGDDIYENNAGASTPEYPVSIVIDIAGNDKYITEGNLSQGTGFMGIGILADVQGNDLYMAEAFSQGAGIFGGGLLLDLEGDDMFRADSYSEGAAIFGIGMLLNLKGNDTYEAYTLSQGFANIKGLGVLGDLKGDDRYHAGGKYPDHRDPEHATKSLSQGFATGIRPYGSGVGASGGIGLLIDRDGDDQYIGDYFSQGSSYWYALGILHDVNGDDMYVAGRYAQGAGIHISAGALIDERGDDFYMVTLGVSQGAGHDFGIGVLADFSGHNTYKGGTLSQGAATCGSIGVLYDRDRDPYMAGIGANDNGSTDESCDARGFGILMNDRDGRINQ